MRVGPECPGLVKSGRSDRRHALAVLDPERPLTKKPVHLNAFVRSAQRIASYLGVRVR